VKGAQELARAIVDDDYRPDLILGIARGGLLVAGALSYALGVKNTFTMNVEFYTGVDERLPVPMILPPVPDLVDLQDSLMLIADDVADTGQTLALVKGFCAGQVGEVRTAVLYEKPRSIVACGLRLASHRSVGRLSLERRAAGQLTACSAASTSPGSGVPSDLLLGEDELPLRDHVELALLSGEVDRVIAVCLQLGHETRARASYPLQTGQ